MAPSVNKFCLSFPASVKRVYRYFSKKSSVTVSDIGFQISAKYSTAVLSVLFCVSLSSDLFFIDDMNCKAGNDQELNNQLTDHCWMHGTFSVKKYLQPNKSEVSIYPGVGPYEEGIDEIVTHAYYNQLWLISGVSAFILAGPLTIWQVSYRLLTMIHYKAIRKLQN